MKDTNGLPGGVGGPGRLMVACPHVWPAARACHAWGAPSSHGCKLDPGHGGAHLCPCGRRDYDY